MLSTMVQSFYNYMPFNIGIDSTRESLESFEFKSGFIYGGFKK